MKILFLTYGAHWEAATEPILEVLQEKGFNAKLFQGNFAAIDGGIRIPDDTDILFLTSNALCPPVPRQTKTFFVPHGIGSETWESPMDNDNKVFLAGKLPWTPPAKVNNWEIVGWPKTDALWKPKVERQEYARELIKSLPYEETVLYVPMPGGEGIPLMRWIARYLEEKKINMLVPWRQHAQNAESYYKRFHWKHVGIPKILNLYYFAPYIKVIICWGLSSLSREFYVTKKPVIHLNHGGSESNLIIHNEDRRSLGPVFDSVWDNPSKYLLPDKVVKNFIEKNDGKVVERILKEIEEL